MKRILLATITPVLFLATSARAQDAGEKHLAARYEQMKATLENKVLSVDFKDAAFEDVIQFFRAATGVNIVVDPEIYRDHPKEGLTVTLKVDDLSAGHVLDLILRFKKLGRAFRYGVLFITLPEKAHGKPFMRMYDVRDLTLPLKDFPGVDIELKKDDAGAAFGGFDDGLPEPKHYTTEDIVGLIQDNCGSETWHADSSRRITIFNGVLIVVQTRKVHKEIAKLLARLRAMR